MHGKKPGDILRATHPQGDFFFDQSKGDDDAPVVLISAGVGLTPMTSILDTLAATNSPRPVAWLHTARSASARAFADHVKAVQKNAKDMRIFFANSRPTDNEVLGTDYQWKGYIDAEKLGEIKDLLSNPKTEVFLCGPNKFMLNIAKILKEDFSVPEGSIKLELFGTGGDGQS
jgi:nitric oxide dioxygenase